MSLFGSNRIILGYLEQTFRGTQRPVFGELDGGQSPFESVIQRPI